MDQHNGEELVFQSATRPTKSFSPMCAVTSTSSPSPPANPLDVMELGITDALPDVSMSPAEDHTRETSRDQSDTPKPAKIAQSSAVAEINCTSAEQLTPNHSPEIKVEDNSIALKDEPLDAKDPETKFSGSQNPHNVPMKSFVGGTKGSSEFDIDANFKRRRSLNSFIDKLVESSLNNPIVDAKISREEYLRLLKLSTIMETKFPRNWELGLKEPESAHGRVQEQPSTTEKVHSDYVIALREKAKNISRGKVMQFECSQISHVEQAQFSVEWRMNRVCIGAGF